jgi:hypothetical protein
MAVLAKNRAKAAHFGMFYTHKLQFNCMKKDPAFKKSKSEQSSFYNTVQEENCGEN